MSGNNTHISEREQENDDTVNEENSSSFQGSGRCSQKLSILQNSCQDYEDIPEDPEDEEADSAIVPREQTDPDTPSAYVDDEGYSNGMMNSGVYVNTDNQVPGRQSKPSQHLQLGSIQQSSDNAVFNQNHIGYRSQQQPTG